MSVKQAQPPNQALARAALPGTSILVRHALPTYPLLPVLHFTQCSACASSGTLNTLCSTLRCSRCAEPQNQLHQLCMLGCWQLMMAWLAEPATTTARGVSNISESAAATPHQSSAKFRCANRHLLPTLLRCGGWSPASLLLLQVQCVLRGYRPACDGAANATSWVCRRHHLKKRSSVHLCSPARQHMHTPTHTAFVLQVPTHRSSSIAALTSSCSVP